jgi:hypothetical protein
MPRSGIFVKSLADDNAARRRPIRHSEENFALHAMTVLRTEGAIGVAGGLAAADKRPTGQVL